MIKRIDHIGIAVLDPQRSLALYKDALGLRLDQIEDIPSQKLVYYKRVVGGSHV